MPAGTNQKILKLSAFLHTLLWRVGTGWERAQGIFLGAMRTLFVEWAVDQTSVKLTGWDGALKSSALHYT